MNERPGKRTITFSLAGAFVLCAVIAVALAAGRVFGYVAVCAFLAAPWPVVLYVRMVRSMMKSEGFEFESRSVLVNVALFAGLAFAATVTLILLGAGLSALTIDGI